jgi:hypothetical protein
MCARWPGAVFVIGIVLYPYVYARRARDVPDPKRVHDRGRAHARRDAFHAGAACGAAAGAARARGRLSLVLLETLNDIGASEYLGVRTLTLSIFTTWLNRGSLPGAAQIACVMLLAVVALNGARALRPPASPFCDVATPAARVEADAVDRPFAGAGFRRLRPCRSCSGSCFPLLISCMK